MKENESHLIFLSDNDLASIFLESKRLLKQRGIYDDICKKYKEKKLNKSVVGFKTVGKVYRCSKKSMLPKLLKEDWNYLFSDCNYDNTDRKYYVYLHVDLNKPVVFNGGSDDEIRIIGRPFYVGKGVGKRMYSLNRSKSHLSVIKKMISEGKTIEDISVIFSNQLTELEAIVLESKLISFFGSRNECDRGKTHFTGMKGGWLVNNDIPNRPTWIDDMIKKS